MLISIVVNCYNRADMVRTALDSVWNQTYRPIELIVVDDEEIGRVTTEKVMSTDSRAVGLGGNPAYTGAPEFLRCRIANFQLRGICE